MFKINYYFKGFSPLIDADSPEDYPSNSVQTAI